MSRTPLLHQSTCVLRLYPDAQGNVLLYPAYAAMAKGCGTKASTTEAAARRTKETILFLAIEALGIFNPAIPTGTRSMQLGRALSKPVRPHYVKDQIGVFAEVDSDSPPEQPCLACYSRLSITLSFHCYRTNAWLPVQSSTKMEHAHTTGDASPRLPQKHRLSKIVPFQDRSGDVLEPLWRSTDFYRPENLSLLRSRPRAFRHAARNTSWRCRPSIFPGVRHTSEDEAPQSSVVDLRRQ